VEQVLFYTTAVYLAFRGYGISSFTYAVLLRSVAGVGIIYVLQPWQIGVAFSKKAFANLLNFGLKFQVNDLLARLKDDLFIVVLSWFLPASQLGLLGWAKRWSMFPYQFSVQNVVAITFPTYSRLQEHKDLLVKAIEKSLYFISLLIFPVLVGMSVMASPLIYLIPEYEKWRPALPLLYLFCVNIGFAAVANPLINTLNAIGKIHETLRIMVIMTVATWVLTPITYSWMGLNGIALVAAVVAAMSLWASFFLKRVLTVAVVDNIKSQFISSTGMGLVLYYLNNLWAKSWLNWTAGVLVGVLAYISLIILFEKKRLFIQLRSLFTTKSLKKLTM
jgi:O-antigen/teichoic acid export membrane protein